MCENSENFSLQYLNCILHIVGFYHAYTHNIACYIHYQLLYYEVFQKRILWAYYFVAYVENLCTY